MFAANILLIKLYGSSCEGNTTLLATSVGVAYHTSKETMWEMCPPFCRVQLMKTLIFLFSVG